MANFDLIGLARWVVVASLLSVPAWAGNPPSKSQCTCDAVPEGTVNNGASVINATACWLTEDTETQWCDIAVQSLEGTQTQSQIVGTLFQSVDNTTELRKILQDQFDAFITTEQESGGSQLDTSAAEEVVPALLKENDAKIGECVSAFRDASFGKPGKTIEANADFRCKVGESSGWLRIEFRVGAIWLVYVLAPAGG
ncbi:hypothetical protein NKI86_24125 [Mesorhizobium sp. M0320]|uniref:hypothetical protein n=1 Tax=unclassified Mesorhizobium TaxID=325217 RepID=UPI00333A9702